MRTVLCHYHIYKNAGTSFDQVLAASFGPRHLSFDGPFPFFTIDQEQLDRIIERKADAIAFSSHQIQLPPPVSTRYRVLSVVFLRDPILRAASIWRFKARHPDGTTTAEAAGRMVFADWLSHCLSDEHEIVHVSNAQTRLVGAAPRQRPVARRDARRMVYDLSRAEMNLAGATIVGLADRFTTDVHRIARHCADAGLALSLPAELHHNATERSSSEPERRAADLLDRLPPTLRDSFLSANDQDFRLLMLARERAGLPAVVA